MGRLEGNFVDFVDDFGWNCFEIRMRSFLERSEELKSVLKLQQTGCGQCLN
jgi:hypothetical protein